MRTWYVAEDGYRVQPRGFGEYQLRGPLGGAIVTCAILAALDICPAALRIEAEYGDSPYTVIHSLRKPKDPEVRRALFIDSHVRLQVYAPGDYELDRTAYGGLELVPHTDLWRKARFGQ